MSYPALPIANHQSMAGYLHQQPSVPSSYSSQATPPAASYPSGYPVNPRHSYSGPPIMLPHPQLQSQRQMSSGPSVMLPHPQLQSQRQMSSGPSIMLPHPQFQSQGQMSPQVIAPSGPSSPIGYNIMVRRYIFTSVICPMYHQITCIFMVSPFLSVPPLPSQPVTGMAAFISYFLSVVYISKQQHSTVDST